MNAYIAKSLWRYFYHNTKSCIELPPNRLKYWDLTLVLKGSLEYTVDGTGYTLGPNDVILIPEGSVRQRPKGCAAKYASFNFTVNPDASLPRDIYYRGAVNSEMKNMIALFAQTKILDGSKSPPYDPSNSRAKGINMLNYILLELLNVLAYDNKNDHVKKAIKYINDNVLSPISLSEVSEHIHLSKEYTASIFKKETQKTVTEYITERKMLYAKELLLSGSFSLSEISANLGYDNYGYFSVTFKKYYGISPVKYRERFKNQF
jgi:AraC-like DNA-binding protein